MSAVSEITQKIENHQTKKLGDVKKGYTYFKKGDILFAKITPCMENGKVALSTNLSYEIGFASTEFHVIRAGKEILPEFVFHIVKSKKFREQAKKTMTGSAGQKRVPKTFLENYEIPLPPLAEQKKIVGKIEKLMAKIDEAKKLRAQALADTKNLLPSALHKIFEEGKKKGWEEKTIDDSTSKVQYGYTTSAKQSGEVKFLRITDIQNGGVNWDTVPFCDCNEVDKYKLNDKDIVFARTGATVGKSYLINNPPQNSIFASYLIRVAVDDNVSAEYVYYFFQSPLYWDQITEQKVGGAQPNVNGTKLKNLKIPLPPLAEQKKIVKYLDSLSAKVRQIQTLQTQTASDLTTLQQSILHKAFNGEL